MITHSQQGKSNLEREKNKTVDLLLTKTMLKVMHFQKSNKKTDPLIIKEIKDKSTTVRVRGLEPRTY